MKIERKALIALLAGTALFLAGCDSGSGSKSKSGTRPEAELSVISSAPDQVTGGDVRIAIRGYSDTEELTLWLNNKNIGLAGLKLTDDGLEGVVNGLELGDNTLEVHHASHGRLASVELKNHPISGPIFSGEQQYPFVCSTVAELGKQPLVDIETTDPEQLPETGAFPVYDDDENLIGYSRDCSLEPFVEFHYMSTDGTYKPMPEDGSRPADLAQTTLLDGRTVDFIVRWERGTINRFLYSYATLAELGDSPDTYNTNNWNGRLLYHFQGGVGIGHYQGRMDFNRARIPQALGKGYAVAYSTGNRTGDHYNLQVGGETALMVKEHFIKRFGEPLYTVAIGGSGGGIQQYVYAQNHPGLLDAGVPQYSYPDMVTQIIHVGDCELLEYYMDVTDKDNPKWQITENRSWLVGFNATDARPNPFFEYQHLWPALGMSGSPGTTECVPAWRGLTALAMNPHYGEAHRTEQWKMAFPGGKNIMDVVKWTHYEDLRNIYGVDEHGHARVSYDNVGVQYGLQALREGNITPEEFLDLNWKIGGWKHPKDMVQEGFPFLGEIGDVMTNPAIFDPWSSRNMTLSNDPDVPAPRTQGDMQAIEASYTSGMVFDGELNIPVIDWRHYLEEVLDMHNSHQSFAARQRIINRMGHADNQVIWFTDGRPTTFDTDRDPDGRGRPSDDYDQTWEALEVLDEWVLNIRNNPHKSIAENRPTGAVDSCFDSDGQSLASGHDVWNGILDHNAPGACTQQFPLYSTSRIVAGGPIEGGIFKCQLKPVATAIADGTYGSWTPNQEETSKLHAIFPEGVCDYSKPDAGRP